MKRKEGQAILVNLQLLDLAALRAVRVQLENTDHGDRDRLVGVRLEDRCRMSRAVDGALAGDLCARLLATVVQKRIGSWLPRRDILTVLVSRVRGLHARDLLHGFLHVLGVSLSAGASKLQQVYSSSR